MPACVTRIGVDITCSNFRRVLMKANSTFAIFGRSVRMSKKPTAIDPRILEIAKKITAKRPKTVVDHIIKKGFITTEELEKHYGYKHPPRAARDVREQGLPLETFRVKSNDGRSIGAYRFANPDEISANKIGGRQVFSKDFKLLLINTYGSKCSFCHIAFEERYLQIDHRVPYEVAGDEASGENLPENFMLVCGTCNRKKSWSCEQCDNWKNQKDQGQCLNCYWATPNEYSHISGRKINRTELVFSETEAELFNKISAEAAIAKQSIPDFIKSRLKTLKSK